MSVRYGGHDDVFDGVVVRCDAESADIRYDDGDSETAKLEWIVASTRWAVGTACEAKYGGQNGAWYPGKVTAVDLKRRTADVRFDDGDSEAGVVLGLLRAAS